MSSSASHPACELSVVVPTLDEAHSAPRLLEALRNQRDVDLEIIVVDGGSSDGTPGVCAPFVDAIARTERGRAFQLNRGARIASGRFILFLHADSQLHSERQLRHAIDALEEAIDLFGHDRVAGHFSLNFVGDDTQRFAYRYLERKSALNRRNTTNGDQGFLLRRSFFSELGGFESRLTFLEDQRMAETIRARGRWITLPGRLTTSARRFETEGFARRYVTMAIIMGCLEADVDNFFDHASDLYVAQSDASRLDMVPVFDAIEATLRERGTVGAWRTWFEVGRYIRRNAWQIPFAADVLLEDELDGMTPFLDFFDRELEARLDHTFFDLLSALLSAGTFSHILPAIFAVSDALNS